MEETRDPSQNPPPEKDYFDPNVKPPNREIYKSPARVLLKFLIIIIILGIVIAAAGSWIFQGVVFKAPPEQPTPTPEMTKAVPPVDPTANWKTYTDPLSRFTFKHPSSSDDYMSSLNTKINYVYIIASLDPTINPRDDRFIFYTRISTNSSQLTTDQFVNDYINKARENIHWGQEEADETLRSLQAYSNGEVIGKKLRSFFEGSPSGFGDVIMATDDYLYHFSINDGDGNVTEYQEQLLDQILTTFKFTK